MCFISWGRPGEGQEELATCRTDSGRQMRMKSLDHRYLSMYLLMIKQKIKETPP